MSDTNFDGQSLVFLVVAPQCCMGWPNGQGSPAPQRPSLSQRTQPPPLRRQVEPVVRPRPKTALLNKPTTHEGEPGNSTRLRLTAPSIGLCHFFEPAFTLLEIEPLLPSFQSTWMLSLLQNQGDCILMKANLRKNRFSPSVLRPARIGLGKMVLAQCRKQALRQGEMSVSDGLPCWLGRFQASTWSETAICRL